MELTEFKFSYLNDIRNNAEKIQFLHRYTNQYGLQFYVFQNRQPFTEDYTMWKSLIFMASPKYYNSAYPAEPVLSFKMSIRQNSFSELRKYNFVDKYLEDYGKEAIITWLNEGAFSDYSVINNTESSYEVSDMNDKFSPIIKDGQLSPPPTNINDEDRLVETAKRFILLEYYKQKRAITFTGDELGELTFAPPRIIEFSLSLLFGQGLIHNNLITAEGIEYCKNQYFNDHSKVSSQGRSQMIFVFDILNISKGNLILKLKCTPPKEIKLEPNKSQRMRFLDTELAQCISDLEHIVNRNFISINLVGDLAEDQVHFLNGLHSSIPLFASMKPAAMKQSSLGKNKVFISYVRKNATLVDKICKEFNKNGIDFWLDRNDIEPGKFWKDAIRNAIHDGAFFLACFSVEYAVKVETHMNEEIILAVEVLRRKPHDSGWFIPVKLSECNIPDMEIMSSRTLNDLQAVMLHENWDEGIRRIIAAIKKS